MRYVKLATIDGVETSFSLNSGAFRSNLISAFKTHKIDSIFLFIRKILCLQ